MPLAQTPLQAITSTPGGVRVARRLTSFWRATLHGADRIPREGPALLVGNHSLFGFDSFPLTALLAARVGRVPRWLSERNLWRVPGLARILEAVGAIPGTPDDAVALLEAGELVCVYPGGVSDSFKLSAEAYTLKWGLRSGFARVALRAGSPIIPFAATGIDEVFGVRRREHIVGRRILGSARYDLPIPGRLVPRRVPLDYYILEPLRAGGSPECAEDVEAIRQRTYDAVDSMLLPYRNRLHALAAPPSRSA